MDYGKIALEIVRHVAGNTVVATLPGAKGTPCTLPGLTPEEQAELGRLRDEAAANRHK